jgi:hypothetical protein
MLPLAGTGCRSSVAALGASPAEARTKAEQMFGALAARFDDVERPPKFVYARDHLGRWALSPSKIWNDSMVWTHVADSARTMTLHGSLVNGRYVFTPRALVALPERVGDSRHVMRLRSLGGSDYDWLTAVDHDLGAVRASDVAALFSALIASAEGRREPELRADYRSAFPRTTRALGALVSLDTLQSTALADGSTAIVLGMRIDPERIRTSMPNYAKYLDKYITSGRMRITLREPRGPVFFELDARDGNISLRLRAKRGELVALTGAARPMPDSLEIRMDAFAKFMLFTVGFSDMVGDFTMLRSEHDRGWMLRFRQEPNWHFPLFAARMLRAPLRRPFEGEGVVLRVGVRDAPGEHAMLYRRGSVAVRESTILRWLGGLGFTAMSDFMGKAEDEENRFNASVLYALRDDAVDLLGRD